MQVTVQWICSYVSLLLAMENVRRTFGAFPLSTVPELLILLISGLVSWRIWEKMQRNDKDIHDHSLKLLKILFFTNDFFAFLSST